MIHFSCFSKRFQWPAIPFLAAGLMAAGTGSLGWATPAQAQVIGDPNYEACVLDLLDLDIDADVATAACALAADPTEMSECVIGVSAASPIAPDVALSACSRDRRPDEVATCVADIHDQFVVDDSFSVLLHCHRSILPERYAQCVTGIGEVVGYGVEESLARCIAAGYRPVDVAPTFIPLE